MMEAQHNILLVHRSVTHMYTHVRYSTYMLHLCTPAHMYRYVCIHIYTRVHMRSISLKLIFSKGCDVLGDDWFRFHGTADVSGCRDIAQEMIFIISGPAAGVDMYFDKIEVSNFARDRSWKPASDLRIDELRKNDVTFKAGFKT